MKMVMEVKVCLFLEIINQINILVNYKIISGKVMKDLVKILSLVIQNIHFRMMNVKIRFIINFVKLVTLRY